MSLLEILQLVGYSFGAALHLWMGWLLIGQRSGLNRIERVLLALAFCTGLWHASNLLISLNSLLELSTTRWLTGVRLIETLAVISITLCYSLLLHVHLHLWANARHRPLTSIERVRVYLSYVPLVFLLFAIPALWGYGSVSMMEKLTRVAVLGIEWDFVVAFAFWGAYVLALVGTTDFLIARQASERSERVFMRTLGGSFFAIGALLVAVHGFGLGADTLLGAYLQTLANLGSLLPTALLAYYIYRYRYLELIIKNSIVVALFATVVLVVYLYGIRALGEFLTVRYGLRPGVVESLLILALALVAAPLRGWLEHRFNKLFSRETALYRDVLARIGMLAREAWRYKQLPELLVFVAERSAQAFGLRRVKFVLPSSQNDGGDPPLFREPTNEEDAWTASLMRGMADAPELEDTPSLKDHGWRLAVALRHDAELLGVMLIDAPHERLSSDTRQALTVIAGQVALAIEECRLIEENVGLERRLAQGERLAALGQMAATVAHEIKNPLSAIKSIAQVMREDNLLADNYSRDLELIVGETDRLSRSVTQLLSWTRHTPVPDAARNASEIVSAILHLFRREAESRGIKIELRAVELNAELGARQGAALHDGLTNLLLNALQATPSGKRIVIEAGIIESEYVISVTDSGAGVSPEHREQIWEPFFTTKQRGTGLGLAIVRKRMEEAGGTARLLQTSNGTGARFELRLMAQRTAIQENH